jgi:beta-aspartyl-peptidase (threonine type)
MTIAIAIHGGAGTIRRSELTPEKDLAYRIGLSAALEAGLMILRDGGTALDSVIAAVTELEENPLFNAGRGAVFTLEGTHELDAAVMEGSTQAAGSVTGVRTVKNPIQLARRVMEATPHVILGFEAADAFAREQGFACIPTDYFHTESRWQALQLEKARLAAGGNPEEAPEDRRHGTVGAVALDTQGRLAAATSTGGMTAKRPGRIGDTPIPGAGTWADSHCAVSCTGHGESFIRTAAAHDLAARMAYGGLSLAEAADAVIHGSIPAMGGSGGLVAVDAQGRVVMPFHCEGMYRAAVDGRGCRTIAIYQDEISPFSRM